MSDILPREKALRFGIACLSDEELLSLIIKSGTSKKTVFELTKEIINKAQGFSNLLTYSYEELISIKGLGKAKALELMAIIEIAKRLTKVDKIATEELLSSSKVVDWIKFNVAYSSQEEFFVIYLANSGQIIKYEVLFKGSGKSAIVGIDEILRRSLLLKASAIIVAHNHPGGNIKPSPNDLDLTKKLYQACNLIGLRLLDHLIITPYDYYSFSKHGLLC